MIPTPFRGRGLLLSGVLAACAAALPAYAQGSGSPTLDAVRGRNQLVCGVAIGVPGFALPDSQGVMRGHDADYCRIVAAATLGDANKVRYVTLTTQARFPALQSGEVDLLARNTTWTLGREANLGLLFTGTNFYDGTGFLVKKAAGVTSAKQLDGATVCVEPGTSTELALGDYFRQNAIKFTPVLIDNRPSLQSTFISGRCDVYSTDASGLAAFRYEQPNKDDYVLLPEIISKEPLSPAVRKGDNKWFDIVRWAHFAALSAEEMGITSKTVDDQLKSTNPDVRRLLGVEGDMGKAMGLDNRWAYNVIKQVGNYGEIWDRNVTPLGIPRGINAQWNKGGLMYAPPIR